MTPSIPTAGSSTRRAVNSVPFKARADAAAGVAVLGGAEALPPLGVVGVEAVTTWGMAAQLPSVRMSVARLRVVVANEISPLSSLNGTRKAGA